MMSPLVCAVRQLSRGTGQGLYECLKKAMAYIGVTPLEWKNKMIGLGCDANLGSARGLKGNISLDYCKLVSCTQIRIVH